MDKNGKSRHSVWLSDEVWQEVDAFYKLDNCPTRNEFVEKALRQYCGRLHAERTSAYLPLSLIHISTVITDFSDLAAVGRNHYMNLHGGSASVDELNALDGKKTARQLIESGSGTITPYGVVYDLSLIHI